MKIQSIISWNVNSIRKRTNEIQSLIDEYNPTIICLQEIRANEEQTYQALKQYENKYKYIYINPSQKRGYSGTATISQVRPKKYEVGADTEGRLQILDFGGFILYNAYVVNGGDELKSFPRKEQFLDDLQANILTQKKQVIGIGDFNVALENEDVIYPAKKAKERATGFTPEERDAMKQLMNKTKLIDTFRYYQPTTTKYSFRGYRAPKSSLWRIDLALARSNMIKNRIQYSDIIEGYGTSDHHPIILSFKQQEKKKDKQQS